MRISTDLFGLRSNTDPKPKEIQRGGIALGLNQLLGKNFAPRPERAVSKINRPRPSPGKYPSLVATERAALNTASPYLFCGQ